MHTLQDLYTLTHATHTLKYDSIRELHDFCSEIASQTFAQDLREGIAAHGRMQSTERKLANIASTANNDGEGEVVFREPKKTNTHSIEKGRSTKETLT